MLDMSTLGPMGRSVDGSRAAAADHRRARTTSTRSSSAAPIGDAAAVELASLRVGFYADDRAVPATSGTRPPSRGRAGPLAGCLGADGRGSRRRPRSTKWSTSRFGMMAADGGAQARADLAPARRAARRAGDVGCWTTCEWSALAEGFFALMRRWAALRSVLRRFVSRYDVVACPVAAGPAPLHGRRPSDDGSSRTTTTTRYSFAYAIAGVPSAVVPAGARAGAPIGVQVLAGAYRDHVALAAAAALEEALREALPSPPPLAALAAGRVVRAWELQRFGSGQPTFWSERPMPEPSPGQVLVRVGGAALNSRDLQVDPRPLLPRAAASRSCSVSDGAGEVVADRRGRGAASLVGDRVAGAFAQGWLAGERSWDRWLTHLGGHLDGVAPGAMSSCSAAGAVPVPAITSRTSRPPRRPAPRRRRGRRSSSSAACEPGRHRARPGDGRRRGVRAPVRAPRRRARDRHLVLGREARARPGARRRRRASTTARTPSGTKRCSGSRAGRAWITSSRLPATSSARSRCLRVGGLDQRSWATSGQLDLDARRRRRPGPTPHPSSPCSFGTRACRRSRARLAESCGADVPGDGARPAAAGDRPDLFRSSEAVDAAAAICSPAPTWQGLLDVAGVRRETVACDMPAAVYLATRPIWSIPDVRARQAVRRGTGGK